MLLRSPRALSLLTEVMKWLLEADIGQEVRKDKRGQDMRIGNLRLPDWLIHSIFWRKDLF